MFPSTGHFKFLHCPFYLEDDCKRIYCHYRHVKNTAEKSGENNQLLALKNQICKTLSIDDEAFYNLMNESNETLQEKNLNQLLKKVFPDHSNLIDDFRLPETSSKDVFDFLQSTDSCDDNAGDLINLTEQDDDTPLDEGPLKEFLAEDAKRNSDSERSNRNTLEKRHIIISCLEKIDKKEFSPRRSVQPKKLSTLVRNVPAQETAPVDMNEVLTQPVIHDSIRIKQEDDGSDSSGSEDNAEVDSILNQMELLNPQLFRSGESRSIKCEPTDMDYEKENQLKLNLASQETIAASQIPTQVPSASTNSAAISSTSSCEPAAPPPWKPRINPKSVQAINSEVTSSVSVIPSDVKSEQNQRHELMPPTSAILTAASIAEQNRLKNVFKNTICANIDQFFDLCDACKVYGTEIFNLLEPLLNYLIEKLNPEFNFEKLRQLHAQNVSLACSLPLVGACDHVKNCIECHNLLQCAMTKCGAKKEEKSVQTAALAATAIVDTPLRQIEAGLFDITKEIISLGMADERPSNERKATPRAEMKHAQCQTDASSHSASHSGSHSSRSSAHTSHRHGDAKKHDSASGRHKSTESKSSSDSRKRHEKGSSSEKRSKHSRSEHRSPRSSSESHKKNRDRSQSVDEASDEEREKQAKRRRSSGVAEAKLKKRSSDDKDVGVETKKFKGDGGTSKSVGDKKKPTADEVVTVDSSSEASEQSDDSDGLDNIPGLTISDPDSDRDDFSKNEFLSNDNGDEEKNDSDDFVDKYPSTASKPRVSHVTEGTSYLVQRKHITKKNLPSPAEVLFHRMQQTKKAAEASAAEAASNQLANDRIRIAHVPNVALLLQAKERIKNNLLKPSKPPAAPPKTAAQSIAKGSSRIAHTHVPSETPKPKDVPTIASSSRPVIDSYKNNNNIPLPTRQSGLDRLFNAFAKKVPPDLASELALKEERTIHEKVTITKIYLNSLAMAIHRITKADPASLIQKNTEFPTEINGFATYDLLSKHLLTYEQLEINGFPLGITARPGCCRISSKAIHYKPLTNKRSGDRFYCLQCKDLFEVDPETGIPLTPSSGCKFHQLRPRKEPGRMRHELFYPCCNKSISESGCVTADHHTLDTTDDDCLENFVETREAPPGETSKTFYSLDCEMCYTTVGPELTRVTIIGPDCGTVYDQLVKPRNKILDYCTKFSGITKEKLRNVTKTLEEVRRELFRFIFKDTILIGHSLENDLKALKILHYNIVDTSVMYPHRDAPERKFALKFISSREVQFLIQESEFGHDSKEDALACMKLVWKKIREDAQSYRPRKIIGSPERNK